MKGAKVNERTLKMKREYVKLHSEGMGPVEIAKKFNLSVSTVYRHLPEIAKKAGVPKESLLSVIHSEHISYEREFEPVEPIDVTGFRQHFNATLASMKETRAAMEKYLSEQETLAEKFEKEEETWQQQ